MLTSINGLWFALNLVEEMARLFSDIDPDLAGGVNIADLTRILCPRDDASERKFVHKPQANWPSSSSEST